MSGVYPRAWLVVDLDSGSVDEQRVIWREYTVLGPDGFTDGGDTGTFTGIEAARQMIRDLYFSHRVYVTARARTLLRSATT